MPWTLPPILELRTRIAFWRAGGDPTGSSTGISRKWTRRSKRRPHSDPPRGGPGFGARPTTHRRRLSASSSTATAGATAMAGRSAASVDKGESEAVAPLPEKGAQEHIVGEGEQERGVHHQVDIDACRSRRTTVRHTGRRCFSGGRALAEAVCNAHTCHNDDDG